MKKKTRKNLLYALGFLVGLSILLYPLVSSKWNAYRAQQLISMYSEAVTQDSDPEEYEEMLEAARAYNEGLEQESVPDAFSVRDGTQDDEYDALLNMDGEGLIGSIEIPAIDVNLPIYHYTTAETLEKGVGHLFGSSLPIGGESTHAVLSAHRGLPNAKLFTDLPLLEIGDVFYIHVLGDTLAYEVDQILTVEPTEVESLAISEGEDLVTLVTCTPYGVNTHRILVRGHRIEYVEEEYIAVQQQEVKTDTVQMRMQALCVLIGLALAVVIVSLINLIGRRKERGSRDRNDRGKGSRSRTG
ncbi:MAG: class C sortase [Lachnospiraceae bacterium]|nr:class C sortase [Lachnospiraceae bacterium]